MMISRELVVWLKTFWCSFTMICASLEVAARIREAVETWRALKRAANYAVTITFFPTRQVDDHYVCPLL